MKQVIVIHGGTTFCHYEDYLTFLETSPLSFDRLLPRQTWKDTLHQELGDGYQVMLPAMPNKTNAQYEEWKIWFTHISQFLTDDCILVGHSLGGIFLAQYLSNVKVPVSIQATILVAAPFKDETDEDLASFKIEHLSKLFSQQAGAVHLIYGLDDPVVKPEEAERYQFELPDAAVHVLPAPDHFSRPSFPELISLIHTMA